jgi:hypothetical protein
MGIIIKTIPFQISGRPHDSSASEFDLENAILATSF